MATEMLPLLIELKAQFYELVLSSTEPCKQLVKRSIKSSKSKYLLYRLCIKRDAVPWVRPERICPADGSLPARTECTTILTVLQVMRIGYALPVFLSKKSRMARLTVRDADGRMGNHVRKAETLRVQ